MVSKNYYEKLGGFSYVLDELRKRIGGRQTDILISDAVTHCNELCEKYKDLSKKEKFHTDRMIFPRAAFYLQMIKYIPRDEAIGLLEEAVRVGVEPDSRRLHEATKKPIFRRLFFSFFPWMINNIFNEKAGFKTKEVQRDSRHYRVDITACPYVKYCGLLGCPELTSTFCLSDDYVFGNMSGIAFERQGTMGRGSGKCDFYAHREQ